MQNINLILKRYAQALLTSAQGKGCADDIAKELEGLRALCIELKKNMPIALNKNLPYKKKAAVWSEILQNLNVSDMLRNFVMLLVKNNRISNLADIIDLYLDISLKTAGYTVIKLVTTNNINNKELDNLSNSFEKVFGSKIKIHQGYDKSIIGGARMYFNSMMFDCSLKAKLQSLKRSLLNS
ncbi:MAG: ATP synthase F1 subunit delta [Alphaproteobacteria bacterium]|jgi:F-type H+-transporting ATPase subunit delta|nr:ATP synthase F1 subunit delta [Candidatus Jidaibacter sp.]